MANISVMKIVFNFNIVVTESCRCLQFSSVCLYRFHIESGHCPTDSDKFHCPKLKTFCLAGFLRNRTKVQKSLGKVLGDPHGIPAKEAAGHLQWAGQPY
jgi:hypothetical protein